MEVEVRVERSIKDSGMSRQQRGEMVDCQADLMPMPKCRRRPETRFQLPRKLPDPTLPHKHPSAFDNPTASTFVSGASPQSSDPIT
jgi:hypothetical protein